MSKRTPAYYNEIDPYAAQWLTNLAAAGHLPAGTVDRRSILDVEPGDLAGYDECHFFAGIGGWPYALALAGWRGPVWTGSCPCQPLSSAGQRRGHADSRHLWPAFYNLIAERRPPTVFGEQVASKDGREWLAGVRADLEHLGYAVGAADLPAAGVGAPHIRQRLFWVADAELRGRDDPRLHDREYAAARQPKRISPFDDRQPREGCAIAFGGTWPDAVTGGLGDADAARLPAPERETGRGERARQQGAATGEPSRAFWSAAEWLPCLDGKARRTQPGIHPLADGISNRVGRLRAYGNAIVPQAAAAFIAAVMDAADE